MDESEAMAWPELFNIIKQKVKPERDKNKRKVRREQWWKFGEQAPALFRRIRGLERILAHPFTSTYVCFAFLPSATIVSGPHNVFAITDDGVFSVLQSSVHRVWVKFFGSSLEDRLRYTPSDCFETFPFPSAIHSDSQQFLVSDSSLHSIGRDYYSYRAELMSQISEGLTDTYNRFHDPDESSQEFKKLRELHDEMDRAVLRAYGWDDLAEKATCDFLLDYEEEEDNDPTAKKSRRKKPWRYRWPDEFRDEVLARLLELNEQRAMEEKLAGKQAKAEKEHKKPKKAGKRKPEPSLFDLDEVSSVDQLTEGERMTLAIVSAWGEGTMVDRLLFGEAAVLWLNDKHRQYRCGVSDSPQKRFKPAPDVTQLIGHAIRRGWLTPILRGEIEFMKLIVNPSPLGDLTDDEDLKQQQIVQIVAEELKQHEPRVQKGDDYVRATAVFARS